MSTVWQVVYAVLLAFIVVLVVRLIFDYVQMFARDWRPHGGVLVMLEVCYSVTDPPLRALRNVIPALRFGRFSLDMGWITLFLGAIVLLSVVGSL